MTVLILDAYNLLFRSFSSLPPAITAGDGRPINAVYGMLAFIARLVREYDAQHVVAAFDVPDVPTFRHELYAGYQAQRGPLGGDRAEDFARQARIAREILPQLGVPALESPGHEADDVMGSLAERLSERGKCSILVSTDRDLLQLVRPRIEVLVPGKELLHIVDAEGARQRLGVPPEGVTTFKALAGDASDNIPGIPGIGAKTATRLVDEFADLDRIYADLDAHPRRVAAALRGRQDEAYLFRTVATILRTVPVDEALPPLGLHPDDRPRALLDRVGLGENTEDPGQ